MTPRQYLAYEGPDSPGMCAELDQDGRRWTLDRPTTSRSPEMNHGLLQDTPHLLPHPAVISPPNSATLNAKRAITGAPVIAMALGRTTKMTVAVMQNASVTGTSCTRRQRAIQLLQVSPDPLPLFSTLFANIAFRSLCIRRVNSDPVHQRRSLDHQAIPSMD